MKRNVILALILLLLFAACYKDGPIISFRSKEKRLLGDWSVISLTIDGIDSTQYYNDSCGCKMRIYKNYDEELLIDYLSCKTKQYVPAGWFGATVQFEKDNRYLFVKSGSSLIMNYIGPIAPGEYHWKILKLTYSKFWFVCIINNKEYLFKLS